ncbi:MAG TPA: hypothetical protein VFQ99_01335 [Gallionella sp.]|nr:hypothetical protein [Gallionella sp.]
MPHIQPRKKAKSRHRFPGFLCCAVLGGHRKNNPLLADGLLVKKTGLGMRQNAAPWQGAVFCGESSLSRAAGCDAGATISFAILR